MVCDLRRVTAVFRVASSFENVDVVPTGASQVVLVVKNPPASAGDIRAVGLIPGSGRSWHGNPLQYSCLVNPMERGAWRAMVHGVAKTQTWTEVT